MRVFRSDDTSVWVYKYGSGVIGNGTASASGNFDNTYGANYIPFTGTAGQVTGSLSSAYQGVTPVLIHQTQGTGFGNYELNFINNGISSTAATLLLPLQNNYIGGAQLITANQFLSLTVNNGVTLSAPSWNGSTGGVGFIMCNVALTLNGTLNAGAIGFRGGPGEYSNNGTGFTGEGYLGTGQNAVGAPNGRQAPTNPGAGQGGGQCQIGSTAGGGGGHAFVGSNANNYNGGNGGAGGTAFDVVGLTLMTLGGGGGGGGQWENNAYNGAGNGGVGGGVWFIIARLITINGQINCSGQAGQNVPTQGGGGGAGGAILLKGQQIALGTNNLLAVGGVGGTGGGTGGAGSNGLIHVDYLATPTGTTNPSADLRFDPSLQDNSPIIALF